ncbi:MAG: heme o synthase [Candidatus Magnetoovum sp. WYHC-5]|nr:heme o synthase [Candidatus Magnetoovum sp. WYHC-5]
MAIVDYIKVTGPRINLLVIVTGFVGMWIGAKGMPESGILFWGLLGLSLASAGASVFNNYYDRDIDALMGRTKNRPLPCGRISRVGVFFYAFMLSATAFSILAVFVNGISALLSLFAVVVYSFLYTVIMKRHTPLATEIGGIAGAMPPVIGWVAVQGHIGIEAVLLFLIMLLWQPPHFWALALNYKDDYKKAGVPVMPVAKTDEETINRSFIYVILLVIASLIPYIIHMAGLLYFYITLALGMFYIYLYLKVIFTKVDLNRQLFRYSIVYLSFSFVVMAVDISIK